MLVYLIDDIHRCRNFWINSITDSNCMSVVTSRFQSCHYQITQNRGRTKVSTLYMNVDFTMVTTQNIIKIKKYIWVILRTSFCYKNEKKIFILILYLQFLFDFYLVFTVWSEMIAPFHTLNQIRHRQSHSRNNRKNSQISRKGSHIRVFAKFCTYKQ